METFATDIEKLDFLLEADAAPAFARCGVSPLCRFSPAASVGCGEVGHLFGGQRAGVKLRVVQRSFELLPEDKPLGGGDGADAGEGCLAHGGRIGRAARAACPRSWLSADCRCECAWRPLRCGAKRARPLLCLSMKDSRRGAHREGGLFPPRAPRLLRAGESLAAPVCVE